MALLPPREATARMTAYRAVMSATRLLKRSVAALSSAGAGRLHLGHGHASKRRRLREILAGRPPP